MDLAQKTGQRVVHLTFHKCGSQWVRNVFSDSEIQKLSGITCPKISLNLMTMPWTAQETGTFLGPVYNASPADWAVNRQPGDRAIVVLRDPRDRMISWIFSAAYSHRLEPSIKLWRQLLLPMTNHNRILLSFIEFGGVAPIMAKWADERDSEHTLITTYEKLVTDETAEFRRMFEFLGWKIPDATLFRVLGDLNFAKVSGRSAGEVNIYSHFRKGVAGDWRSYFNRELGALWEERMPGLLCKLGYEQKANWFEDLPEVCEVPEEEKVDAAKINMDVADLNAQLVRLTETFGIECRKQAELKVQYKLHRKYYKKRVHRLRKMIGKLKNKRVMRWARSLTKLRRKFLGRDNKRA